MHVFISRPSACFLGYFLFFSLTGRSFDLIQFIPRDENFVPLFCLHSQRNESSLLCTFSQRHLRGVDSTRWWVFPLSNGSRGSCRRGPNGRGDVVGGRGQQRARICQRWTRSVVAVSVSSTEGLYVWLWLRIMEKNGNSTDWDHSQRFGLDVDAPRPFDSATDVGIFWITVKLLESLSSRSEESHPGGLKSLGLQLKPSRG